MTIQALIDAFVQEKISATELLSKADEENYPANVLLDLMRQEVKEAEEEQGRMMMLLLQIQRDPFTMIREKHHKAINILVNGD